MSTFDDLQALAAGDLGAEAEAFGATKDPLAAPLKDLLPPTAAFSPEALAQRASLDREAAAAEAAEAEDVVTLDFFGDELPVRSFKLRFPFRLNGEPVTEVEVHQLTVAEVGQAYAEIVGKDGGYDRFALYGLMVRVKGTGTPLRAAVIRKLKAVDGEPITDACFDFLPPSFRPAAASTSTPPAP